MQEDRERCGVRHFPLPRAVGVAVRVGVAVGVGVGCTVGVSVRTVVTVDPVPVPLTNIAMLNPVTRSNWAVCMPASVGAASTVGTASTLTVDSMMQVSVGDFG